jgi:hypothetical protein
MRVKRAYPLHRLPVRCSIAFVLVPGISSERVSVCAPGGYPKPTPWRLALVFVLAAGVPSAALSQPLQRVGTAFQVNVVTEGNQYRSSVAATEDGFVVVWSSSDLLFLNSLGIFGRRVSSSGTPMGVEFLVNVRTTGVQSFPQVASDSDGDFVVVWDGTDGGGHGIFGRRFSSSGVALGGEFQVNEVTVGDQTYPHVGAGANGDFVVAWTSSPQDGFYEGVFARRFDSSGAAQGGEFQVNTYTPNAQSNYAVGVDSEGDFVVLWDSYSQDGSQFGMFARRYDSAGVPLALEFQVNTTTVGDQDRGRVGVGGDGDFVAAWASQNQDGSSTGVFARRFDSAGVGLGGEFQVNLYTAGSQSPFSALREPDGAFVVVWSGAGQGVATGGIFSRRFDSAGVAQGGDLQVNPGLGGGHPAAASRGWGEFLVAWTATGADGSGQAVFAQRLGLVAILDVDANGSLQAIADALLVVRYQFGFTGAVLTFGAVATNCMRCDAAAIESYLAGLGTILDVDGDGSLEALTDGLLVLRYLFGFTGDTLTAGAVGTNCTRCNAGEIVPYLQTLD